MLLRVLLLFVVSFSAAAGENCRLDELHWPAEVELAGETLELNGAGSRRHLFWDVYAAALYLPAPRQELQRVLGLPGPKRLALHFLHAVSADKLREGWRDGFRDNHSVSELANLSARLERSYQLLRGMADGDRILLDYLPGQGTRLTINGEEKAVIAGADFYAGILRIWIGSAPAQDRLRECLLGRSV